MKAPVPEAQFDLLFVVDRLSRLSGSVTRHEVSLFCYLACLLSVFRGAPPNQWGYSFAATKTYSPYSEDLASAIERSSAALVSGDAKQGVSLTDLGTRELGLLAGLRRFETRIAYLDAACSSALAMPIPRVSESVSEEPLLKRALDLSSTRALLDESGREAILRHFSALIDAFPDEKDLFLPAVVWLTYLSEEVDRRLGVSSPS